MAARRSTAKKIVLSPRPRRVASKASSEERTVSWWDDFYRIVRLVPPGRVTTYGTVAALGGHPRAARHVGFAMAALKDTKKNREVPWQRVLGAAPGRRAKVTIKDPVGAALQRAILEAEGVEIDARGRVDLDRFGWAGPSAKSRDTAKRPARTKSRKPARRSPKSPAKSGGAPKPPTKLGGTAKPPAASRPRPRRGR
jgi:methylated-DNA-protein-cysteine methyltransferase-like protein